MKVGLGRAFARVLAGALALALCAGCGQRGEEPAESAPAAPAAASAATEPEENAPAASSAASAATEPEENTPAVSAAASVAAQPVESAPAASAAAPAVPSEEWLGSLVRALECSGLSGYSWEGYRQIDRVGLAQFTFYWMQQEGLAQVDENGFCTLPAQEFEAQAARWVEGLPEGWLREGFNWYQPEEDAYRCNDVLRYDRGRNHLVDCTPQPDGTLEVTYTVDSWYGAGPERENRLTLAPHGEGYYLVGQESVYLDQVDWCAAMNLVGVDYDFEDPSQLTNDQLTRFACWVVESDGLTQGLELETDGEGATLLPVEVLEQALALRLGEGYQFDPTAIEGYDQATGTVPVSWGYGGARFPGERERTQEGEVLTLVVDYYADPSEQQVASTRFYRLWQGQPGQWKLLAAGPYTGE